MFSATLRTIRRLFGLQRTSFQQLVERAEIECANINDVEVLSLALKAKEAGDCGRAATLLSVASGRGNAEAQFRLGEMFVEGDVPTERFPQGELSYRMQRTGVRWLTAAAQAGHVRAEARLASIVLVDANTPEREAAQARRVREEG